MACALTTTFTLLDLERWRATFVELRTPLSFTTFTRSLPLIQLSEPYLATKKRGALSISHVRRSADCKGVKEEKEIEGKGERSLADKPSPAH